MAIAIFNDIKFDGEAKKAWEVIKKKLRPEGSTLTQKATYWLWIECICEETGVVRTDTNKTYISNRIKKKFGYTTLFKGETIPISTKDMTKDQMRKYMDELKIYFETEQNIFLPNKEDKYFEEFYQAYRK